MNLLRWQVSAESLASGVSCRASGASCHVFLVSAVYYHASLTSRVLANESAALAKSEKCNIHSKVKTNWVPHTLRISWFTAINFLDSPLYAIHS